jgi:predicted TIM-barrel fold metal-dependent hydrolase
VLGRHANVWFDLAALPAYVAEDYPFPTARRYLERAVGLIGAERLMWGSDAPGLLGQATYPQLVSYIARHCPFLSAAERAACWVRMRGACFDVFRRND